MRDKVYKYIDGRVINVTNITNVTNVSYRYSPHKSRKGHKKFHKKFHGHGKRPKLYKYCSSCGLLDSDLISKMSSEEICSESVNVAAYAASELCSDIGDICRSGVKAVGGVFKMGCGIAKLGSVAFKCLRDAF